MAKILIVEDDEKINRVLTLQLRLEGYEVETSFSGEECLNKVKSFQPHLLILDYLLPDCRGFEIVEKLRSDRRFALLPLILLTGIDEDQLELEVNPEEGIHLLAKPFESGDLLQLIRTALSSSRY
jgi:DNA-binding response OmpR family regulator